MEIEIGQNLFAAIRWVAVAWMVVGAFGERSIKNLVVKSDK